MIIQRLFSLRNNAPDVINLKNGVTLEKTEYGIIAKLLRNFRKIRERQDRQLTYDAKLNGKTIGYIQVWEEIPKVVINIMWLYIEPKYEGNHYATEVMKAIIDGAKRMGYKKLTLEVPGSSPNARHIYEKLGFVVVKEEEDEIWDGLTYMEKTFSQKLFSKTIRDKNALRIAKERLKGMRQKQIEFLKKNLEKSVVSKNPEKVVNDMEAFKKRVGRAEINKVSDSEYAKKIEKVLG